MRVNPDRLQRRLDTLATMTLPGHPYTRRAFTPVYLQSRAWLASEFSAAGLETDLDAAANLIGRHSGREPALPVIALGSHTDTVSGGGRYDGMAGVIAALEVADVLQEAAHDLRHPLWVIDFLSEEASDYGASCVGSRALAGTLGPSLLDGRSPEGEPLRDAITRMGGKPDLLTGPLAAKGDLAAYLELHIEQGPVLEQAHPSLGIVTGITGIRRLRLHLEGQADHSGTTPMALRHDALVAAAEVVVLVHRRALADAQADPLVATVGHLLVQPNTPNVVPGAVDLVVEARSLSPATLDRFFDEVLGKAHTVAAEYGVTLSAEPISDAPPVSCSADLQRSLRDAATARGYASLDLPSGAGHDAMQVARLCPVGMLFIPCRGGRSHAPEEEIDHLDLVRGTEVLLDTVLQLDRT